MAYIYKITNKINNKVYIGQTAKTIEERFKRHLSLARQGVNRYLYDAINHYGESNFVIEQIEECSKDVLNEREKYWIKFYNSTNKQFGYNMTDGGGGGDTWTNNPHKEETLQKAKETKLKRGTWGKATPKGTPSPNKGKFIVLNDKESLLQDLKNGLSNQEIMKKYDCGYTTLFLRCKTYFNATPDEVRGIKAEKEREKQEKEIAWKQHLEELTEQRKQRWTGEKNPNYIDIDYELLDELLIQDKTLKEIAPIMGCAHNTLISKIKKRYNMTTREYREYVKSKNSN